MSRLFRNSILSTVALSALVFATSSQAAMSPLGISIFPPLQFPPEDTAVTGLRVNLLWGSHRRVYGVDVGGLGNITTQSFGGILQVAGLMNYNKEKASIVGLQFAGLANLNRDRSSIVGVQASLFNSNQGSALLVGLGLGLIGNSAPHATIVGAQLGLYNSAGTVYGFQVGLVNVADVLHGIQIGLLNIHRKGLFKICPIINFGF